MISHASMKRQPDLAAVKVQPLISYHSKTLRQSRPRTVINWPDLLNVNVPIRNDANLTWLPQISSSINFLELNFLAGLLLAC